MAYCEKHGVHPGREGDECLACKRERGRELHRKAHAQPKPAPDLVRSMTLTDGHGRQWVVDVEIRTDLIARALGAYARDNTGRLSKACDGGVIVRYVREVV